MPNIPDSICTDIKIDNKGLMNLLLISIALEELSLAKILNSEGEMMQTYLRKIKCDHFRKDDLIRLNKSVNETLRIVLEKEKTLQEKLRQVIDFYDDINYRGC